ncbi:hypothetical protein LTR78_006901 [Recurvomyces mirabilis]|uniref:Pali-domain-containing protein n=1 Tax=Recurvomyces mirabilis TaxID=574656 RepID=A0AAE1BZE8_9PEZI|nr:hypothetical protein LTR78_006901 [Recurvomyces mirabilis]KAK5153108.1 hypothetical protein LTS14_007752 [Recurvomyces mirabilis]
MALYSVAKRTHWIGVALLFISSLLLLFTTISAPIMNGVSLLHVTLTNETQIRHSSVSFGTFGYCILDVPPIQTDQDWCTKRYIGYEPADIMAKIDKTSFSEIAAGTSDSLTRVMVLHPVACGLTFVAFLCSMGAGVVGSLAGVFVAFVAWILVLISLAVDFSLFGIVRHHVNTDKSGSQAKFGSAIWLLLASFVTLFLGMLIVFFTCCSAQREKKRGAGVKNEGYPSAQSTAGAAGPKKKRFGLF